MTTDTDTLLRLAEAALKGQISDFLYTTEKKRLLAAFQEAANPAAIIALCKRVKELEGRIEAAHKRLGDLKAYHTRWAEGREQRGESALMNDMESIAYSAGCYLEGIPGNYLPKTPTE